VALRKYGVLKSSVAGTLTGADDDHYQIKVKAGSQFFRIAVNVKSKAAPSEVMYYVDEDFQWKGLPKLKKLADGFTRLPSKAGGVALDYLRDGLFPIDKMIPLPADVAGPDNDLNEKVDSYVERALNMKGATLYAFGERWGPEKNKKDRYFSFKPGNGIHDIHMNQGNADKWRGQDGIWQDGGLIIHLPKDKKWVAIFLRFQSQATRTDEKGHRLKAAGAGGGQ
jgi:uncharacterized protein YukJ